MIQACKIKLDAELKVGNRRYEVRTGTMQKATLEDLQAKTAFKDENRTTEKLGQTYTETTYDVIGEIEAKTRLTRRTIVGILKGIRPTTFALLEKNPEVYQNEVLLNFKFQSI